MRKKLYTISISKRIIFYILLCCILVLVLIGFSKLENSFFNKNSRISSNTTTEIKGRVAIIIDDFGNNGVGSKEILEINRPLTCAVIPFLKNTKADARDIFTSGHEVIIHMPMEPHIGDPKWLGEKGITEDLELEVIKAIVEEAIADVPFAVGMNNHMGSKVTENKRIMETIILVLKDNNMYFLDSKTSSKSVVKEVAIENEVPYLERLVFLDNRKDVESIKKQLRLLGDLAIKHKTAVAIGHVGPEGGRATAKAIKEMIPELEAMGVEILPASKLINNSN
ncbi:divergent polysaccharide deacetylase family protein [Alkaliphilus pronyensis]|uniref:Divergent polysaccharide deacetylase family protein n=1 Tax=Alkaliphilus pronyensis TaxID=1482732 RepID=A0A6I0FH67_9FIRM|nr:divergent polysaccharide deacetylase family protein [Alkaliphilus pronyensis]KAB3535511.1 divergent polysaccharide deacetylase family protein [Alkaliphilus pronyensis]